MPLKTAADLNKAINVFTKTLLWKLTEGHPVTPEEIEALNEMRVDAGMEPLQVPEQATSAPAAPKAPAKKETKYPEAVIHIPSDSTMLPDNDMWRNRFEFHSDSGSKYLISQSKTKGYWGCTCWPWKKTHHCKHLESLGLPGGDQSFQAQLKKGSKTAAELIHSDAELDQIMETVPGLAHIEGPEAGPSNDELHENSHEENGVAVTDGDLKSPERANMNAMREALETQVEMEVGKPIEQKQEEVAMQEKVQDAALAQGAGAGVGVGVQEVSAKPGTQIVINIASKTAEEAYCDDCDHEIRLHVAPYGCEYERGDREGGEGDYGPEPAMAMGPCGCKHNMIADWCDNCIFKYHPTILTSSAPGEQWETQGECQNCGRKASVRSIKTAKLNKVAYVKHCPGHKNSKGESAEWCIYSHETGKIISSEKSSEAAHKQLQNMHAHSASNEGGAWSISGVTPNHETTDDVNAALKRMKASPRVRISEGSGIDSNKEGVVIPWDDPRVQEEKNDYPFVGGRTPQGMGWLAILLDDGTVTSMPKNRVMQIKRSAEPIGGENQPGATAGHAGGMFGGTDLEGPQFHVGFTFRGKQRKARFSSYAEAHTFIAQASVKFGKMAGDWTMKCPHCGSTASKDNPQDNYSCPKCGWNSAQSKKAEIDMGQVPSAQDIADRHSKPDKTPMNYVSTMKSQASAPGIPKGELLYLGFHGPEGGHGRGELKYWGLLPEKLYNRIVRGLKTTYAGGSPEELRRASNELFATLEARSEQVQPGTSSDEIVAKFKQANKQGADLNTIDPAKRALILELLKTRAMTTGQLEKAIGGHKYSMEASRILNQLAKEGLVKHKQMRWSLKTARTELFETDVRVKTAEMSVPERHQLRIAIQTLKMPDPMVGVMGGMDKAQALKFLADHGMRWDDADYMAGGKGVKKAGDGMAKTEEQVEKEAGFNLFFPGQVLQEFYPEIQHEIVDYPNASNSPMGGAGNPEITGDGGHDLEGMLDSALDTSIVEMVQLPADVSEPMEMAAADYSSTSPAGGMGIGRDGKPEVLEGAPLRKENDIRGAMFTDEFYGQYDGIPGAAFAVASQKTAAGDEKQQFSKFLKMVCGEIAATMVAAFKVTQRPLLDKVPGVGELQLDTIEQGNATMPMGQTSQGGRVKYLMGKLNDSDIKGAINEAWAQAAVWNDSGEGGFIYEVFVRPETIDTDSMKLVYKFVAGTRG